MTTKEKHIGTVVWFSNILNFGFIKRPGHKDIFVHYSDINCEGFKTLRKGAQVAFGIGQNNNGDPKAIDVTVINN